MPRPKMPPTPASSAEIKGQDHSSRLPSLQLTFELPPSAIPPSEASHSSRSNTRVSPPSPPLPQPYLQPSETVKARRRAANTPQQQQQQQQQQQKEVFSLPPPPTRSRRIIQMKPRSQEDDQVPPQSSATHAKGPPIGSASNNMAKAGAGRGASSSSAKSPTTANKRQPSATSAAGRKIARKTAHSLIERRRRSKMNEEFGVLKSLIPACTGDMHKLAILQASIEYVRYLKDCVEQLKVQCQQQDASASTGTAAPTPTSTSPTTQFRFTPQEPCGDGEWDNKGTHRETGEEEEEEAEEDGDVEMTDSSAPPSPVLSPAPVSSYSNRSSTVSVSPALLAQDARTPTTQHDNNNHNRFPQTDYHHHRHYIVDAGVTPKRETEIHPPSMTNGPRYSYPPSSSSSLSISPPSQDATSLASSREMDHEISAALLMLGSDSRRRGPAIVPARGMSVRDLLSS
ncbi:hypothetical protein F5Y17DRAFT_9653 [Xylariaceae sp. FL0594]|nr:hypothetical protein F5Y17DRAFT_9653 [Xylariaceae sp. FL0594]